MGHYGINKFFFTKSTFSFSRINWKPTFFFYNTFYSQSCSQIWFNERFLCHLICFHYRPGFCSRNVFTSFDTSFFLFQMTQFRKLRAFTREDLPDLMDGNMCDNFRPCQPIGDRSVKSSFS